MNYFKIYLVLIFNIIAYYSYGQGEYIVEINRTDGSYKKIDCPIQGINWVFPNIRGYNETDGIFYFQGSESTTFDLYSIDVTKGIVINNPYFNISAFFTYDNLSGNLYSLVFNQSESVYFLEKINPATGEHTPVSNNPIPNMGICQGFNTFDETNHKFIICSGITILSIDANSGTISSNTNLKLLPGEVMVCASLSCDNSNGKLYALLWDAHITNNYFLVSINPITGDITKIGKGSPVLEQGGSSDIDKENQQFLYLHASSYENGWVITTIDIATGNIVYSKLIKHYSTNDNFLSLAYDNKLKKLFSIHWLSNITNNIDLGKDATICPNNYLTLNAGSPAMNYKWNTGETTNSINVSKQGTYTVTLTNGTCYKTGSIDISLYPLSQLYLGNDTTICFGCTNILNVDSGFTYYKWQDGTVSPTYTVYNSGTYSLEAIDTYGCKYYDEIFIRNESEENNLFVPNAFIPNNISLNNIFKVIASPYVTSFNIKIFNRWGTLIFETNDTNAGWDGKYKNNDLPQDIYTYIINYSIINSKHKKLGSITLLR